VSNPAPILVIDAVIVVVAFAWPRTRQIMARWIRAIVETPLRAITGTAAPGLSADRRPGAH
jgi:hypothetical protein